MEIRILIVEDDTDWLRGLSAYLTRQPDLKIVGTASTAEDALTAIREGGFDVAILDVMLGDGAEGVRLAEEVTRTTPARVLMLTSMQEKDIIVGSFQAGALDYLVKSDFEAIPEAVRSAFRKESPISAAAAEKMREEFRRLKELEHRYEKKEMREKITPSELQVLKMIDKGYTQNEIADRLFLSIRTVKVHVGNILRKLGSGGSKEAARKAREYGLFEEEADEGKTHG